MKSQPSQPRKIAKYLLPVLLAGYLALLLFPQLVFAHKLTYRSFTVYTQAPADPNIYAILDQAEALLARSELSQENKENYRLLLCSSFAEYAFFAPAQFRAFASYNPVTGNILIAGPEIGLNQARRNGPENNRRSLSGVIAHEATHALIRNSFGFMKHLQIASWKKEGYCDHIARESTFDPETGMALFCKTNQLESASFQYFKYRLYVAYLLNHRNHSFMEIAACEFDLNELEQAVKREYCTENATQPPL